MAEQQPDAFVEEREEEDGNQGGEGHGHSYRSFMKKHLKQYGGDMQKAASAYREQKGCATQLHKQGGPISICVYTFLGLAKSTATTTFYLQLFNARLEAPKVVA